MAAYRNVTFDLTGVTRSGMVVADRLERRCRNMSTAISVFVEKVGVDLSRQPHDITLVAIGRAACATALVEIGTRLEIALPRRSDGGALGCAGRAAA